MSVKFDFDTLGKPFEATWPVTVQVPQDGGKTVEQSFEARFVLLTDEQIEQASGPGPAVSVLLRLAVKAILDDGKDVLTPVLLDAMLSKPFVREGLSKAYGQFAGGIAAKN